MTSINFYKLINSWLIIVVIFFKTILIQAQNTELNKDKEERSRLSEIVFRGDENESRIKKEEVNRVESLNKTLIQEKKVSSFAQVIDNEKGLDTQTACAFCGAKRISINGLKGEHTTILVDGMPLHSTISGFYGIEAIPLEGIESIDIYRGAGASLSAPESIGGSINIISVDPFVPIKRVSVLYGVDNTYLMSLGASRRLGESMGVFIGTQYSNNPSADVDQNGITESPHQKNLNIFLKSSFRISEKKELSLKLSSGNLDVYGGNPKDLKVEKPVILTASSIDFENNDVRKKFLGDSHKITDNVNLKRNEITVNYQQYILNKGILKFNLGRAEQIQDSIYSHGFDYRNRDEINFLGVECQLVYDQSLIFIGADLSKQNMTSSSEVLYSQLGLKKDNLHRDTAGIYFQDTWALSDNKELSFAVRADQILVEWDDHGRKIEETIIAPRLNYKYIHNSVLTSRIGLGIGYRSPLTLFESQHGTDHNGFIMDIQQIEKAQSLVYSLYGQRENDFFEVATHVTNLQNMSYGIDRAHENLPTIFTNSSDDYYISVSDFNYGRKVSDFFQIEGLLEFFNYPIGYKNKLPVAAQEKRLSFNSTYNGIRWIFQQKINIVFEQDLSNYGYGDHFNIAYVDDDIFSTNYGKTFYQDQKKQTSPTFFTLDLSFKNIILKNWNFEFEVKNVFDYTQTGSGDSPLTWAKHGNHFHLDNFHIWGPQLGRRFFVSVNGNF